jgi:hypothetical protein
MTPPSLLLSFRSHQGRISSALFELIDEVPAGYFAVPIEHIACAIAAVFDKIHSYCSKGLNQDLHLTPIHVRILHPRLFWRVCKGFQLIDAPVQHLACYL